MPVRSAHIARWLTRSSVRHPWVYLSAWALVTGLLLAQATRLTTEVGYPAYFGPEDPAVRRLDAFLEEFGSGFHVLVAFGCRGSTLCESATDEGALRFIAKLQERLDALPNVRRTTSVLNAPILVGFLQTRTLARRDAEGHYRLEDGWRELASRAPGERFLRDTVISRDGHSAGIVVELQSLESDRVRAAVHGVRDLLPGFERALGSELYLAGDPVWTVISADDLSADSTNLTALMFMAIFLMLFALFRSFWLTLLPVLAVGALTGAVHGVIALLGIPLTSVLAALPPVLVVIVVTGSLHLLTAFLRSPAGDPGEALVEAAGEVGAGCGWAVFIGAAGFLSFLWSDLGSFRHFGGVGAIGLALGYATTFTLLPALVCLCPEARAAARARTLRKPLREALQALCAAVARRPRFVLVATLLVTAALGAGVFRLRYETSFGFGERHFVYRSLRYIEANLRKPMTTELVVDVPEGRRIYDPTSLQILQRIESHFAGEPSTGAVWSFLDFLEEAYRVDKGEPPASFAELVEATPEEMPLVAGQEQVSAFWSESVKGDGSGVFVDRARVSADRAWLDDRTQGPYVDRLRELVANLNTEYAPLGYRVELEGGLILADSFIDRIRDTQWRSFGSALAVVVLIFVFLLWGSPRLVLWAVLVNVLPVAALLGTMGWAGIGVDPANSMVAAILISLVVDDTIHLGLRYRAERRLGARPAQALVAVFLSVGEAIVGTSLCLALGFSMLMFSRWGGLVSFGLLASLGVLFALVCELLLLPAALLTGAADEATERVT